MLTGKAATITIACVTILTGGQCCVLMAPTSTTQLIDKQESHRLAR